MPRHPGVLVRLAFLACLGACASGKVGGDLDASASDPDATGVDGAPADGAAGIDAATCARAPCDILAQCGCEATPTTPVCDLDTANLPTGATKCRANEFMGRETTTCTRATTCDAGYVCLGGRCGKYCDDDDDCPGAGGLCVTQLVYGSPGTPIPGAPKVCSTDCVPSSAANPTCPTTWACHLYLDDPTATAGDERYYTSCNAPPAAGTGTAGMTCTSNTSCAPGLDCITLNPGGNQCRPTCLCPGGNCGAGMCPGGTGTCRGFTTPVTVGGQTYGTCF